MAHIVRSGNVQARIAELIKLHPVAFIMKGSPSDAIEINLDRKPEQLWRTPPCSEANLEDLCLSTCVAKCWRARGVTR
jgi:hypothetical protein